MTGARAVPGSQRLDWHRGAAINTTPAARSTMLRAGTARAPIASAFPEVVAVMRRIAWNETVLPCCHSLHFTYAAVMGNARARRLLWAWIIAAVLAILLLIAFFAALVGPKIPVHQGKNLYAWTDDLQKAQQNYSDLDHWKKIETANTAIRAIGTNAIPFVMADIRARVTIKVRVVNWLAPRVRFLKLQPIKVEDRWIRAIRALEAIS